MANPITSPLAVYACGVTTDNTLESGGQKRVKLDNKETEIAMAIQFVK